MNHHRHHHRPRYQDDQVVTRNKRQNAKKSCREISLETKFLLILLFFGFVTIIFVENYHAPLLENNIRVLTSSFSSLLFSNSSSKLAPESVSSSKGTKSSLVELAPPPRVATSSTPPSEESSSRITTTTTTTNSAAATVLVHSSACNIQKASHPWTYSSNIPDVIKEYLDWHVEMTCMAMEQEQQRPQLKYLIVQCLREFGRCGGLSDRVRYLPAYVLAAYQMKRVLLFQWTKPCHLEEFFMSPPFGINWTVPEWLTVPIKTHAQIKTFRKLEKHIEDNSTSDRVLTIMIQFRPAGFYNNHIRKLNDKTSSYTRVYHDLFHCFFTLVQSIQSVVDEQMASLSLTPGTYTSVHVRARHPDAGFYNVSKHQNNTIDKTGGLLFEGVTKEMIVATTQKALNCASLLSRSGSSIAGTTIYFASDSHHVTNDALLLDNSSWHDIVGISHQQEPLHLDEPNYKTRKPSDYYALFVDLWLLGNAKCTVFGWGGFGLLASYLSFNSSCHINYQYRTSQTCIKDANEKRRGHYYE